MDAADSSLSHCLIGAADPVCPVILSVPHAGRDYPDELRAALAVPLAALLPLEDRHVDAVALAARRDESVLIARHARAWIDLNRSEADRDPMVEQDGQIQRMPAQSAKVRSGLGLVPRRAGGAGTIWRRRWTGAEIDRRILASHRPYHAALAMLIGRAQRRFGYAVLIDVHSMPPLNPPGSAAQVVIGDRFGRSASPRLVARMEHCVRAAGLRVAVNTPYAGGHLLDRHGAPGRGIHAVQVELDRSLYLNQRMDQPGPGVARCAALVRALIDAAMDELAPDLLAAE